MPNTFSTTEKFRSSPQEIWTAMVDVRRLMRWIPAIDEIHQLDEGDLGRGSVLSASVGSTKLEFTVSYWEPVKGFTVIYTNDRYILETAIRLLPDSLGTDVNITQRLQGRGLWRFLGPALLYLRSRSVNRWLAAARADLENSRSATVDMAQANQDN